MADAVTTLFELTLPEVGASTNTWGDKLNANLTAIENIIRDLGNKVTLGGSANAYTFTPSYTGITALTTGLRFTGVVDTGDAATGASTLNYDGIGAKDIVKLENDGSQAAIESGDMPVGWRCEFVYLASDDFLLLNPANKLRLGSVSAFQTGTATDRFPCIDDYWEAHEEVILTDAATITWNMSTGINFFVTIEGNRTLAFPTGITPGKRGYIRVHASGATRTLALGASYVGTTMAWDGIATATPAEVTNLATDISLPNGHQCIIEYIAKADALNGIIVKVGYPHDATV